MTCPPNHKMKEHKQLPSNIRCLSDPSGFLTLI